MINSEPLLLVIMNLFIVLLPETFPIDTEVLKDRILHIGRNQSLIKIPDSRYYVAHARSP